MSPARARSLSFAKYSGAGNDFLIVDERHEPAVGEASVIAKALCRRGISVGADGLIVLSSSDAPEGAVARMRLWNADGSSAEFSGNAARCAVRYLVDEGLADGEVHLATDIGIVRGAVDGRDTRVSVPGIARVYPSRRIRVEGRDLVGTYAMVGVPFFVLLHDEPDTLPVRYLGRSIRNHAALQPAGANVDFVRVDDEQNLYFRVYERGVENETLSSGTGSIAAALAAAVADKVASPVACTARGGVLTVRFRRLSPEEVAAVLEREAEEAEARAADPGYLEEAAVEAVEATAVDATAGDGSAGMEDAEAPTGPADRDPYETGMPEAVPSGDAEAEEAADTDGAEDSDGGGEGTDAPELPKVASGEAVLFGDIEVEGDTRRVMTGTAHADALRLR